MGNEDNKIINKLYIIFLSMGRHNSLGIKQRWEVDMNEGISSILGMKWALKHIWPQIESHGENLKMENLTTIVVDTPLCPFLALLCSDPGNALWTPPRHLHLNQKNQARWMSSSLVKLLCCLSRWLFFSFINNRENQCAHTHTHRWKKEGERESIRLNLA